ncbi:MAG: hypothetical protein ABW128_02840, partial [Rhizorhabdus sp.]
AIERRLRASLQAGYWLYDAGMRIGAESDAWQIALIGRNLGNKRYITRANDVTFTGRGTGTSVGTLADVSAVPSRGREVMVRLTVRPSEWR